MEDFKKMFSHESPIKNGRPCNSKTELDATKQINEKMIVVQREFSSRSEMSHSITAGFHFSC